MGVIHRYPLTMGSTGEKIPFVLFTAYEYKVPGPDTIFFDNNFQKNPANIDQVAIYMPGNFSENITATWSPENIIQGGNGANWLGTALSNFNDVYGQGSKLVASAQAMAGAMPFPTDINIFRGVEPMTIPFSFTFMPTTKEESTAMNNITRTFKTAIMPTRGASIKDHGKDATKNVLLQFPAIWDITVHNMNGLGLEFAKESKFANMCLTGCTIDYSSGTEGAAVFHDGNPIGLKLNLTFTSIRKHFPGI